MEVAVRLENVSKRFTLHHQRARSFQDLFVSLVRWNGAKEDFWALRDVNLEIRRGETLGIIGHNGSGKSTILKLISRILEPTAGKVVINGTVSALLELGAGFHPDLTGKENVYLNGALLGMSRKQMDSKYEEIVEFSELRHFIDTPVKHYSSGMYMRLAFAVAVSVDPDILITDEVLAVGDDAFQRKCLERMNNHRLSGKTVVIVSHAMEPIVSMCDRAIWLSDGQIRMEGSATDVVRAYIGESARLFSGDRSAGTLPAQSDGSSPEMQNKDNEFTVTGSRWGSFEVEIVAVEFLDENGCPTNTFQTGTLFTARIHYMAHSMVEKPVFVVAIHRSDGVHVNAPNTRLAGFDIPFINGKGWVEFTIPELLLLKGDYLFTAAIYDEAASRPLDHHDRQYPFGVSTKDTGDGHGVVRMASQWRTEPSAVQSNGLR